MNTIAATQPFAARQRVMLAICVVALGVDSAAIAQAPSTPITVPAALTLESLDAWRDLIVPDERDERWRDIPWRTSLWQGLLDAQIEGKPMLIWVMNGHPMGCT